MRAFRRCAASALFLFAWVFVVAAQSDSRSQTLFTINGKPVSTEEFIYLYRKNHQHKPEDFTRDKIEEYLTLFINYKLKVEEALSRGMDTTAAFKKEYQTYRDELLKPYLPDVKVIDSLVALTYDRLREEVNASHILIRLDPDATPSDTAEAYRKISEIRLRALAGEDFNALAAQHSEEPGAQTTKGNLGYFTAMQMVFPFEQAAYLTPVGDVSPPVRTQFGYHIVKVWDRQPSRGEVEVSHIMIRSRDDGGEDEAKDLIFDIYDKLQKGVNWEELCRQYSEDPNSKENGGRLRPFGVGAMASVPEFQEMAFALEEVGEISDPVHTRYGWHILRLESKIPLPSFEEMKPALTQRVSRDERVQISKAALRRKLRDELGYTENASTKEKMFTQAETVLSGTANLANEELFTMQGQPYLVKDFKAFMAEQGGMPAGQKPEEWMAQRFTSFVDHVQLRTLEEKVKRESPDYKWLLKEYYEGILLFEIMEKEVWNKAMEDSLGQRRYFEQHRNKYTAGERAVGIIYSCSNKKGAEALRDALQAGDALEPVLALHKVRVDSGAFEKEDRSVLSKIQWGAGVHQAEVSGVYYAVDVREIAPPGPESFEEARASVISDYQTFLEDSWISELKRKFGVRVEKRAKKRAFAQLMDQKTG